MKKSEIKKLEELLNREDVKGKYLIKEFIWRNTVKPKFEKDEKVLFTDLRRKIYGVTIKDFVGIIIKRRYNYDYENPIKSYLTYEIEFEFNNEKFKAYVKENEIKKTKTTKVDNGKPVNDCRDCFYL